MKAPSPLLGFNNNVRHKGRVFHIQTEDSGIRHPHIITHLFADGGRILKTTKTSYAEHLGQEKMAETVRAMMQDQHKAMFIALRDGQFDYLFEDGGHGSVPMSRSSQASVPAMPAVAAPPAPATPSVATIPAPPLQPAPVAPVAARAPSVPPPPRAPSVPPPPSPLAAESPTAHAPPNAHAHAHAPPNAHAHAPPTAHAPPAPAPTAASRGRGTGRPKLDVDDAAIHGLGPGRDGPSIDLDMDALERAAAEAQTPFFQQIQDLPPPPAAVLGTKRAAQQGGYSQRGATGAPPPPPNAVGAGRASPVPLRQSGPPHTPAPPAVASTGAGSRYAPSRPASIFATTRPQEGTSIFGEDLISEKSLDEVILSYLAEDLDGPGDKK